MSANESLSEDSQSREESDSQEKDDGDLRKRAFDPSKSEHAGLQEYFSKVNHLVKRIKTTGISPQPAIAVEAASKQKPHPLLTSTMSSLQRLNLKSKLKPKFLVNDSRFSHHITEKYKARLFETIDYSPAPIPNEAIAKCQASSEDIEKLIALIFDIECVPQTHFVALMKSGFDRFCELFLARLKSANLNKSIAMWIFQLLSHFCADSESDNSHCQFTSLFEALLSRKSQNTGQGQSNSEEESLLDFLLTSSYLIEQKRSENC